MWGESVVNNPSVWHWLSDCPCSSLEISHLSPYSFYTEAGPSSAQLFNTVLVYVNSSCSDNFVCELELLLASRYFCSGSLGHTFHLFNTQHDFVVSDEHFRWCDSCLLIFFLFLLRVCVADTFLFSPLFLLYKKIRPQLINNTYLLALLMRFNFYLLIISVCGGENDVLRYTCAVVYVWKPMDTLRRSVLSFHLKVGAKGWTWVSRSFEKHILRLTVSQLGLTSLLSGCFSQGSSGWSLAENGCFAAQGERKGNLKILVKKAWLNVRSKVEFLIWRNEDINKANHS